MKKNKAKTKARDVLTVSVAEYARLAGRDRKTVYEQAKTYGLPIDSPPVRLGAVLRRFHDILAELAPLYQEEGEDGTLIAQRLRAEIRVKRADAEKRERDNAAARGEIVTVSARDALLVECASIVVQEMERAIVAVRLEQGDTLADQIEAICTRIRNTTADRFGRMAHELEQLQAPAPRNRK